MEIKKNLPLFVALGIPLVLILVIAFAVYLPGFGPAPQYDFVYVTHNYYGTGVSYDVVDGKIIERPTPVYEGVDPRYTGPSAQVYYYDVETNSSKTLSLSEAQGYKLETNRTSPDGYIIENGRSNGIFPFYETGNYYDQYLIGHNRRVKTTISDYDFSFLGWVGK